jgi:hypothetical protein
MKAAAPHLPDAGAARPWAGREARSQESSSRPGRGRPRCAATAAPHRQRRNARSRPPPGPAGQHRHALAGVVGAAPGRVVAVIGGEDGHVAGAQPRRNRPASASNPPARGHSPPRRGGGRRGCRTRRNWQKVRRPGGLARPADADAHQVKIGVAPLCTAGDAAVGEDVADLADGMHGPPGLRPVHQRRRGRGDGEVAPVAGAGEAPPGCR